MTLGVRPERGRARLDGLATLETLRTPLRRRSLSTGLRSSSEMRATPTGVIAENSTVPRAQKCETTIAAAPEATAAMIRVCTDNPCRGSRTSVLGGSTDVRETATPDEANEAVEATALRRRQPAPGRRSGLHARVP